MKLEIITDNKWKNFKYGYEVPDSVLNDHFDYLSEDEKIDGFIQYRSIWYHISEFMRIENNPALNGWQGYSSDSFFSGVLINISDDGERYQIGTYIS